VPNDGAEQSCMFHAEFAGGIPHRMWSDAYNQGHLAADEEKLRRYPFALRNFRHSRQPSTRFAASPLKACTGRHLATYARSTSR
jgi:hypothetical protein